MHKIVTSQERKTEITFISANTLGTFYGRLLKRKDKHLTWPRGYIIEPRAPKNNIFTSQSPAVHILLWVATMTLGRTYVTM